MLSENEVLYAVYICKQFTEKMKSRIIKYSTL